MAFAQRQSADAKSGSQSTDATSWTLEYPTNLRRGDFICAIVATDGVPNPTMPAGWVQRAQQDAAGSAARLMIFVKYADGTETGNFTLTLSAAEQGVWRIERITAWHGIGGNSFLGWSHSCTTGASGASGTSTAPDASSLSPVWSDDTLWIAMHASDDGDTTTTGFPTNYTNGVSQESGGAGGAAMGVAFRELNAASEDASAFTIDASQEWAAMTFAIRPYTVPVGYARPYYLVETNGTTATANAAVELPDVDMEVGDLLLVHHRNAVGTAGHSYPAGWNVLFDDTSDASDDRTSLAWRKVDGTEGATITITQTNSKFASQAIVIKGSADPDSLPPQFATLVTGTSAAPDPGSLSPSGGAKNYLWITLGAWEGEQTSPPVSPPTNYVAPPFGANSGTAGNIPTNCRVASAFRWLNAASEDPEAWSISSSDDWTATVVAIHPATSFIFPRIKRNIQTQLIR